jgi:hypothetical protein
MGGDRCGMRVILLEILTRREMFCGGFAILARDLLFVAGGKKSVIAVYTI